MELSFKVKKPPHLVFDYLTDMQKFTSVHPVITKIAKTASDNYMVYETLRFGFIPFSFSYPIIIHSEPMKNTVIIRAMVMKIMKIEITFKLKKETEYTIIEENIRFKSFLPVRSLMERIFKKQHTQLFKNIGMTQ